MEGSKRFVKENCSLPQYRLETWANFLFINFDKNAPSLQSRMQTLDGYIENYRVPAQTEILHYEWVWEGNWKLSAENPMKYYRKLSRLIDR